MAHGVRRLVLLSGRGEPKAQRAEQAALASDADVTVIRASWFGQNFSESFFLDGILAGELVAPVNGVREPFVDADDIADVAVAALGEPGHAGRIYEVTGPRAITFAEEADAIAVATGRGVAFMSVPIDDYVAALAQDGVPGDTVELLRYLFTKVLDGRNTTVTDGVERALGRPPRAFEDFVRRTAATGVWGDVR